MPVASWILFPKPGRLVDLVADASALPGCQVRMDDSGRLAVLVSDTSDSQSDRFLHESLQSIESLAQASLVFAHAEDMP